MLDRIVAVKVINQSVAADPRVSGSPPERGQTRLQPRPPQHHRVHDFQVEGDTACITMDYVPDSLDQHIRAGQPLPYQRAVQIACTGGRPAGTALDVRDGR